MECIKEFKELAKVNEELNELIGTSWRNEGCYNPFEIIPFDVIQILYENNHNLIARTTLTDDELCSSIITLGEKVKENGKNNSRALKLSSKICDLVLQRLPSEIISKIFLSVSYDTFHELKLLMRMVGGCSKMGHQLTKQNYTLTFQDMQKSRSDYLGNKNSNDKNWLEIAIEDNIVYRPDTLLETLDGKPDLKLRCSVAQINYYMLNYLGETRNFRYHNCYKKIDLLKINLIKNGADIKFINDLTKDDLIREIFRLRDVSLNYILRPLMARETRSNGDLLLIIGNTNFEMSLTIYNKLSNAEKKITLSPPYDSKSIHVNFLSQFCKEKQLIYSLHYDGSDTDLMDIYDNVKILPNDRSFYCDLLKQEKYDFLIYILKDAKDANENHLVIKEIFESKSESETKDPNLAKFSDLLTILNDKKEKQQNTIILDKIHTLSELLQLITDFYDFIGMPAKS